MKVIEDTKKKRYSMLIYSVKFISVVQLCPTLCDHMDCSMPGFPVLHNLPELTQTHVHQVSDAIRPSHPPSSPSPPASIFHSIRVIRRINIVEMSILPPRSLQIQHNVYENSIPKAFFIEIMIKKKKLTICMEQQKTPNSQSNFELEK